MKPMLAKNTIHIWKIDLGKLYSKLCPILNDSLTYLDSTERQRAARFMFDHHRQHFIAAHYAMRHILQRYLNLDARKIVFITNKYGKPALTTEQNPACLEFNLSHSADMALLALRYGLAVGIDIECISNTPDYLGIARHTFATAEYATLAQLPPEHLTAAFFHIWVQKEAFIKAVGYGLSYDLKDFSVAAQPPARLVTAGQENVADWFMHSFVPTINTYAAIASMQPVTQLIHFDFKLELNELN